ncbi:acyl-[acyl-carrier-protein] thioesterase [Gordonia crocea]|uniref:Acyl-ACP thioesterase n=1 Tax=Gordonia crocea TaxID=589162 RepID=A0A7I9UVQ4_9ACTN|nr:acyl-ACP thioesterase domain-containing protein [Gordonia crocea]GED97225.1 acyl-ACP thioesterase [Gordonia crocea]
MLDQPLQPRPDPMDPYLDSGALSRLQREIRIDAVRPDGHVRFDAVARYLQDAGHDHLKALDYDTIHPHWIARRTVIDLRAAGVWPETVTTLRWGSKMGSRWCNVRIDLDGDAGTRVETEAFWVNFNAETATPSRLDDRFVEVFGSPAEPGPLRWKAWLDPNPHPDAEPIGFTLRDADLDVMRHVNNSVYWAALEEALGRHLDLRDHTPLRGIVEFNSPLVPADAPRLLIHRDGDQLSAWLMAGDRNAAALAARKLD